MERPLQIGLLFAISWIASVQTTADCSTRAGPDGSAFADARKARSVRLLDSPGGQFGAFKALLGRGSSEEEEGLRVDEGGTETLQWRHLQSSMLDSQRTRLGPTEIRFGVSTPPKHGQIVLRDSPEPYANSHPVQSFTYADVLTQRVQFEHDGSETLGDSFELKLPDAKDLFYGSRFGVDLPDKLLVPVHVTPLNDVPQLRHEPMGPVLHLEPGSRLALSDANLHVSDPDSTPDGILVHVEEISANLDVVDRLGARVRRFSLADLRRSDIYLLAEDEGSGEAHLTLIARDGAGAQSTPLTIYVTFAPLKLVLDKNAGIRLIQQTSQLIESAHLNFHCAPQMPIRSAKPLKLGIRYSVVDQPKFGVVECANESALGNSEGPRWMLCSAFEQRDIDELRVRYRHHSGANRTTLADSFHFQVHCVDSSTRVQTFQIDFVTLSIRVFVKEPLTLNETDQRTLSRRNLLATVFPHNFQPDQLVFNIVDAPKLGMLLRHVPETGRQRRVGVSSNFSQQHIDDGLVSYKLHFAPFSVLNDFFTFRLLTPAGPSDEVFRFEIVYLPGGSIGAIYLMNRTLVVPQGGIQQISNGTLWLESGDGSKAFSFRIALPPLNGDLLLKLEDESRTLKRLALDDIFTSADILGQRLLFEHSGDQSRIDRIFLLAESEFRDPGGGKGHTPIAIWLHVSVVSNNSHSPQSLLQMFGRKQQPETVHIYVRPNDERTVWPSLLPWLDLDESGWPSPEQLQPPVARLLNPLLFHLTDPSNSRDFVICSKHAQEIPLREFSESQLRGGDLVLRHLAGARGSAIFRYTVTDGRHTTAALLSLSASIPTTFVRLTGSSEIQLPFAASNNNDQKQMFLVSIAHLRAETNENVRDSTVQFEVLPILRSPFHRLHPNGSLVETRRFTQMDLFENRVFLANELPGPERVIPLKIQLENMNTKEERVLTVKTVNEANNTNGLPVAVLLSVKANDEERQLVVVRGGSAPIERILPRVDPGDGAERFVVKYHVVESPRLGEIVFQRRALRPADSAHPSVNYNIPILSFDDALFSAGSIQYVQNCDLPSMHLDVEDGFAVNISVQQRNNFFLQLGPFNVPIRILAGAQLLLSTQSPITVPIGAHPQTVLEEQLFAISPFGNISADFSRIELRIVQKPPWIALVNKRTTEPIMGAFSHAQLRTQDILVTTSGTAKEGESIILLRACTSPSRDAECSRPAPLRVRILDSTQAPFLERNNPAQIPTDQTQVTITPSHLQVSYPGKLAHEVHFMVWELKGGHVKKGPTQIGGNGRIGTFTQEDVQRGRIQFEQQQLKSDEQMGFKFLFTDGLRQSRIEWFSVKRPNATPSTTTHSPLEGIEFPRFDLEKAHVGLKLERNGKLNAAPGVPALIGPELLKAATSRNGKGKDGEIAFRLTKPPTHGRLLVDGLHSRLERFTQADVDSNKLTYLAQPDLGAWMQRDHFQFKLERQDPQTGRMAVGSEEYRLRIETSYTHLSGTALDELVPRQTLRVSNGGALALNITHMNLTKIIARTEDEIFVKIWREPGQGWLERVDEALGLISSYGAGERETDESVETGRKRSAGASGNGKPVSQWRIPLSADQFHSGLFLIYHHSVKEGEYDGSGNEDGDEFTLLVYGGREQSRGLKLNLEVKVVDAQGKLKVDRLPKQLHVLSGSSIRLNSTELYVSHPKLTPSQIVYRIEQPPRSEVRTTLRVSSTTLESNKPVQQFTQFDVDNGLVNIEHMPLGSESAKWDLLGMQIGGNGHGREGEAHHRVLIVRIEPLALQLRNHSDILIQQGKTYVLLNSANLGAESNGERSHIFYNVTKRPENGTFYWVDGEKEAIHFSQTDVDSGNVLYAQMNMNAFGDAFEFVLSNEEMELLPKRAHIRVEPVFQAQPFLTSSRTITQLGLTHLNATALEGASPRYLVIEAPHYGRLFLHPQTNQSAVFFTHSDVVAGRLFYHSFETQKRLTDHIVLELKSDNAQPARMEWPVEIRPSDVGASGELVRTGGTTDGSKEVKWNDPAIITPPSPEMNYHFPVAILAAVVLVVVGILLCRRKTPSDTSSASTEESKKEPSSATHQQGGTATLRSSLRKKTNNVQTAFRKTNTAQTAGAVKMPFVGSAAASRTGSQKFGAGPGLNLLDATVYATINSRQISQQAGSNQAYSTFNHSNDGFADSPPNSNDRCGNNQHSASAHSMLSSQQSSVTATIPTFQSPRRCSSPTRRIPVIALPPSRSESRERQQILANAAVAAIASRQGSLSLAPRELLQPEKLKRRGSESQALEMERKASAEVKNEFWV